VLVAARVREHATYEDLLEVPDNMVAELIEGELYASPRPGFPHADAASELVSFLRTAFGRRGNGDWHIVFEPQIRFGQNVLVPDIAGWRVDRVPVMPRVATIGIAPDWVCEVLSYSTARIDRQKKLPIYASAQVSHAWIVDVDLQNLEVKRLENGGWRDVATFGGDAIVRAEPFDAIEIQLSFIWGPLPA